MQAFRFLAHYLPYLRLSRAIRESGLERLAVARPEYRFKYLGNYLSPAFRLGERAAILGFNYRYLAGQRVLPFRSVLAGATIGIGSRASGTETYSIELVSPQEAFLEGDLALRMRSGGKPLYKLSFSFLPGCYAGLSEPVALLIAGSQGYRGTNAESRRAAKAFGEICPAALLLIHARALAAALGIRSVLALPAALHSCEAVAESEAPFHPAYDALWEASGAERTGLFYRMPAQPEYRLSTAATNSHRARARRKQEKKSELFAEALAGYASRTGNGGRMEGYRPMAEGEFSLRASA